MNILEELILKTQYLGKFRAIVKDIADPKKMRRLRVVCPCISEKAVLPWALPCAALKTDWLPKKGDVVWIEFEGSQIDFPIWVGLAVAKEDVDADFLANYNEKYRKDRDYNGNSIEWKESGLIITDKNGNTITMSATGIELEGSSGVKVKLKADGITLASGDAVSWKPNTLMVDPFSGCPHSIGIVKLKGA